VLTLAILSVADGSSQSVVVDLRDVSFLDVAGIHALLTAQRHLSNQGIDLRLRKPSPRTRRVLQITGVDEQLVIIER
jgi:anti-sigma B factor antagonist